MSDLSELRKHATKITRVPAEDPEAVRAHDHGHIEQYVGEGWAKPPITDGRVEKITPEAREEL